MINVDRPVFIVGTPRSGTTLVAKILGRHPAMFMPGETHFFDDIYSRHKDLGDPRRQGDNEKILERLGSLYGRFNEPTDQQRIDKLFGEESVRSRFKKECQDYGDVLNLFMAIQAEFEGKRRWGNNTPRDIFHVQKIIEIFPRAIVLVCVRDVRDFLLSYKGKWRATAAQEVDRLQKLYHPVVTSLLWKSSMQLVPEIQRLVPSSNFYLVQYEKLVAESEMTIKEICAVIGEEYDPRMLEVQVYHSSHGETGKAGISSASVGKWQQHLSAEEIWWAQVIAGKQMRNLGYKIERVSPDFFTASKLALGALPALFRGLNANKEKRGPLLPYLASRLAALVWTK